MSIERKRYFTTLEILKLTNLSRTILMGLKASGKLKAGKHFVYVTGKPRSNINWDLEAIEKWQQEETLKNAIAPYEAAEKIETFSEMGVDYGPTT